MRRIISCLTVALFSAFAAMTIAAQDDFKRVEAFGGYTYAHYDNIIDQIDDGIDPNISLRGFNGSITYNFHRYVGAKFDYALTANRKTYNDPSLNLEVKYKNNQFLGGVQFKDNSSDGPTWKPFGHILAGVADQRLNLNGSVTGPGGTTTFADSFQTANFAMVFGAGLDVKVHKHVDIRLIQFDYNPVFFGDQNYRGTVVQGTTQNNFRLSFGAVFH